MRSTARRGLVLLSLALLGVVVTGLAETEPPPQLYRIEVEIVGEHGQVELDPEGTPGAPGVFWYWGQPLDVQLTATSDDPERPFEKWLVGLTGEEPEERIENPTDVSFSPEEDDWTVVAVFFLTHRRSPPPRTRGAPSFPRGTWKYRTGRTNRSPSRPIRGM